MDVSQALGLGFLYPGHAAEDDYAFMEKILGSPVRVELVHTTVGEDAHEEGALKDLGDSSRLLDGAAALKERGVKSAMWACTSGSFVFGWSGAEEQIRILEGFLGVPTSSTPFAFVEALRALGKRRVAVAATYPEDVTRLFKEFLAAGGAEVVHVGSRGIITAEEVGTLGKEAVLRMAKENDHPEAETLLLPDTALHTAAWLNDLEETVGKPVLTANQVTMWRALRLAGVPSVHDGLGSLFRTQDEAA